MRLFTWFCERCGYLRSWVHICADHCAPSSPSTASGQLQ